jgi:hypothetical protein
MSFHNQTVISRRLFLAAVLGFVVGCGSQATGTITGTVTLDGAPVKAGMIVFIPADGIPRHGDIQPDGSYRVDNVPVGDAIVVINPPPVEDPNRHMRIKEQKDAPPAAPVAPPFPTKYWEMSTSDLRCPVKAGNNVYEAAMKR